MNPVDEIAKGRDREEQATAVPRPSAEPGKLRKLVYVTLPGCWGALIIG
jgi:hypothetical protein